MPRSANSVVYENRELVAGNCGIVGVFLRTCHYTSLPVFHLTSQALSGFFPWASFLSGGTA